MGDLYYEVAGTFYTEEDGPLEGYAWSDGEYWHIIEDDRTFSRWNIFLDRDLKVLAPKNEYTRNLGESSVREMVTKYRVLCAALRSDREVMRISGYRMRLQILLSYLQEYETIYQQHFMPLSIKYILGF